MLLTITPAPLAEAGDDLSVCAGDVLNLSVSGTVSASNFSSLSWSSSGDGTFDDTSILEPVYTPGVADISNGTVVLTLTASGNGSCDPDVDTMTLTITAVPTADAGSDETICAATAYDLSTSTTSPTASNFSSVLWTTSGDGAFDDNTVLVPVYTPGANDATNGTVTLTLEAFGIGSCSSVTDNVVMTITPQPAANAGSDEEICATDVFDMNLFATAPTVSDNNGLLWSTSGTGTFGDASQLITTYTPSAADIAAGTVTLTLTALGNANCTDVSDDMVLTITPDAIAEAGDDLSVCAGDALDLSVSGTVSASNFSSLSWSSSGDGAFDDTSVLDPVYTPGVADISNGTVVLTLTASGNGSCDPDVDTMTLTITAAPTADAGSDEEVCSDVVFDMTASATSPTASNFSSVLWTTSGDGTFGDASSVVTTYTPGATDITNGTATLTLTANGNGSCDPAVDNMLLTITPAPLAEAGSDSALCDATQIDLSTLVTAPSAANGSIQWTTASSDGSFSDATVEQPIYTFGTDDIANGTAKLYLTVTGAGSCDPAVDSVEFILGQGPVVFAGIDSEICSNEIFDFASLAVADQPTASNVDSIRWETAGGDGAFGDIRTLLTTYTPGTQDSINGSVTLRLIGIGAASCVNDTSEMTLTITPAPLAEAGSDSTLCDATQIDLSTLVTAPSAANGSIQWTTASSDGSFSDATVEQPIYTFGTDDIANGTAKLYLTVTGAGSCDPAVDSVEFTISQGPVVFAGIDSEVCSNEIFDFASLAVADQPTASNVDSIRWETAGGDGAFGDIRTLLTTYTPGTQDSTNGSVTLRLIGIGAASCVNDTSTMTLTVSPAPNAGVGTDTTICNTTSSFDLNAQLADADAGTWTKTGGTGSGEDNTNIGTGIIDFTGATVGTYEYTYTVAATANCPEDTEVVTITVETIAVQNVTNLDPFDVCAGEDIFVNLDGSESGVTYEVLVNGAPTTPATTAVGGASPLNITLASGLFADGDVISVEGSIGSSCVTAMNNTFTVNIVPGIAIQDVGTPSALNICSGTDLTVSLTGSELGVTYEALVNDSPTGAVASGVAGGAGISISVPSSEFGNGDVVSVQGSNGVCTELMNGDITLNVIEIIDQSIQNAGTVEICTGDQFILILDDSEIGVDYELFISTSATGLIKPGDGDSLAFVLPNVTFSNVDLSIRATSGSCSLFLSDEVYLITKDDIVRQNVTNSNPTQICPGNDLIVSLDGSELGVDYEVLINGIASGTVLAGTGNPIDITLPSGNFVDGDSISVTGTFDACTYDMTGTFAVQEVSISISESITNPSACGASDGSIDIDVTGNNSGNFSFMWTLNGSATFLETTEDISGLSAGTYKVQVTDNITNCIDTALFTLQESATYTVVGTEVDQQQCGVSDGSIDITVTPTSATATFLWSGPGIDATNEANEDQNNLAPGSYEVTVSDNGCTVIEQFTIDPVQSIAATSNSNLATCGANDGVINVDVTQVGSNIYEIFVRDAGGTLVADSLNLDGTNNPIAFTGLGQGNYDITVRDVVTNCEINLSEVVSEDASFTINPPSITNITTCGAPEGAISLTFNGLVGPTTFNWTGPGGFTAGTQNISGLSEAGIYTITIEDAGCTVVRSFTITQPSDCDFDCNDFKVTALTEAASCFGIKDGKIFFLLRNVSDSDELVASVKPAGAPDTDYVSYTIDNPGKGLIVEIEDEFTSGTYTVFLEDIDQSCTTIPFNVNIGTKFNITSNLDITQPTCEVSTGTITVSLNGTTDSFTFELYEQANPATPIAVNTNGIFNTVDEGDYFIRFINNNANGCSLPDQQVIINNTAVVSPGAVDINVQQPDCNNPFGVVSASLNNLPSNYEFILINQSGVEVGRNTTGIFSGLTIGTYLMQFVNTVDPGACEIPDRGNIIVQNSGSFTVTVSDTVDVKCFGSNTGSVVLTLDGLSTAFYSIDNGTSWEKFTSGNPITGLPAINNILVSDSVGAAGCNISVAVNIGTISSEINLAGSITLVTEASCTSSELIGEIKVPEITGGVAPYIYLVDNEQVTLDDSRIISGLSRTVRNLVVIDSAGCAKAFEIGSIVSPNEVRLLSVREIEPDNNCLNEPQGIKIAFSEATLLSVPGPYELVINKVGDTSSETIPLVSSGIADSVFIIGQDLFNFEKGASYRYTIRSVTNDQACSADGIIPINGGAIVPDFTLEGVDVACFGESGSIMISNIIADPTIPLFVELFIGNSTIADETFILDAIPQSRRFIIGVNNFGQVTAGDYFVRIAQLPQNCGNIAITSNTKEVAIDAPTNQLQVELVPEPNLAPGIVLDRENMNPMPTTRPDKANGAISIRLVSTTSALSYSAQIFLLEPLGGNNRSDYILPDEPQLFNSSQTLTFNNLLPGIYEIEYYDSFGCGLSGDRLVFGEDGTSNLVVDFDRSPFIPNLFTPNNDGKNDVFEILNLPDNGAELIVTNRSGAIVYKNDNYRPSDLWDGGDQPDGIYFYQLTVDNTVQNGWVEILRGRPRR
ncbi:hypothetical protein GCM10011506_39850 [Marivirga lumbricoides]|uniref:Ig-like domain-containing protein n=2 Tax=Marivirga lumbricoides TaxID=1046115 RepID=A0ABQ1MZS9_9BACT|nr:hypothetical protein GCM10011506_39850 [Marivirga lumbricoides]